MRRRVAVTRNLFGAYGELDKARLARASREWKTAVCEARTARFDSVSGCTGRESDGEKDARVDVE